MESIRDGNIVMARLKNDSAVREGILDAMERHSIYSCAVLCGIGMLKDVTLGYFEKGKYLEKQHPRPMELLSMQGFVTVDSTVHVHVVIGDRDYAAHGGHMLSAKVCNTLEMTLLTLDSFSLTRKLEPSTGLRLLAFRSEDERPVLPPL